MTEVTFQVIFADGSKIMSNLITCKSNQDFYELLFEFCDFEQIIEIRFKDQTD
jgi:hypothetical protein